MNSVLSRLLALGLTLWLTGCNLTTDRPLFSAEDAADVKLESGYYADGTKVAYIQVFGGKTVVNTQNDSRVPYQALAVDLGEGIYLLQYGKINEAARTYVLFRYDADGLGISTAVYDCNKDAAFFRNFGISIKVGPGECRMSGATKERLVRAQRALAKALPEDNWRRSYRATAYDEGARTFESYDSFPGRSPSRVQ
ncbi:hypothetical protein [Roseateles sp. LYH14W]|uniref:Lipoprotein n=1 Tax=Pelomonas parva TaxID=3299032 RepID=A0ABW7FCB7_9BURK